MVYSGKECLNLCLAALNKIESIQVYFSQVINGWSHGGSNRYPSPTRLSGLSHSCFQQDIPRTVF